MRLGPFLAASVVVVAACGSAVPWDGDRPTIEGTTWRAVGIGGDPPLEGTEIVLRLGLGTLSGTAGCNAFSTSEVTIGGGAFKEGTPIEIGDLSSDDAVCEDPAVMGQEAKFFEILATVEQLRIDQGLSLEGPRGRLHFVQNEPDE